MKLGSKTTEAPPLDVATLTIDIGGSGLRASVLDSVGKILVPRVRVQTPDPCTPEILLDAIAGLVASLPPFDRISVGFPGVVRDGRTLTAPHFETSAWCDFPLAAALSERLDRPVRMLNDAEVQGFGIIKGHGLELVLTLGTGAGTALFRDGALMPHLELAQHPVHGHLTYNDYIGSRALKHKGKKKWSRHVRKTITILKSLLHYDVIYLGGGNADKVEGLTPDIHVKSNQAGITGGIRLWDIEAGQTLSHDHGADTSASTVGAG